jgi:hypothetical protein
MSTKHMSLLCWLAMAALGLTANILLTKGHHGLALQGSIAALSCAMYGAALLNKDREP